MNKIISRQCKKNALAMIIFFGKIHRNKRRETMGDDKVNLDYKVDSEEYESLLELALSTSSKEVGEALEEACIE